MFIPSNAAFVYSCKHVLWISITRFYLCLPYSLVYHSVCLQCGRLGFNPQVGKIPWRRKWRSTPVLLLGKSHGQRSLVGYSPWGRKESDTTERLHFHFSLSLFTFTHWRRKWQPTPVFLPGESQGWGSLVGCRLWGRTESDTTEAT